MVLFLLVAGYGTVVWVGSQVTTELSQLDCLKKLEVVLTLTRDAFSVLRKSFHCYKTDNLEEQLAVFSVIGCQEALLVCMYIQQNAGCRKIK